MENIMSEKVSIGILAVQGAFAEHQAMLDGLGADTFLIRQKKDLEEAVQNGRLQGIVLPGGERISRYAVCPAVTCRRSWWAARSPSSPPC